MIIQGFGSFHEDQIESATAQRFISSRKEAMNLTAPTAAELGITTINVPVTFSIKINTFRDASEWASDYIKNGRPLVFEVLISSTDTTANLVALKIVAAFDEYVAKFNYAEGLPFTYSNTTGVITMVLKDSSLLFREYVEFKVDRATSPVIPTTTKVVDAGVTQVGAPAGLVITLSSATNAIIVGDTVSSTNGVETTVTAVDGADITLVAVTGWTAADDVFLKTTAVDPTFDGKYLEENVRMSLSTTSDSYGISPDEKPLISGHYTSIEFIVNDATLGSIDGDYKKHAFLGTTRGEVGGTRKFKFTLYILEGTDMFTTGATHKVFDIIDFLVDATVTPVLKLGTGELVTTAAAFVA